MFRSGGYVLNVFRQALKENTNPLRSSFSQSIMSAYYGARASKVALVIKNPAANAGNIRNVGSVPGLGRSPGGGHGNPLQYSCLENPMDRGAWWAIVHGVAKIGHNWSNSHTLTWMHYGANTIWQEFFVNDSPSIKQKTLLPVLKFPIFFLYSHQCLQEDGWSLRVPC